MNYSSDYYTHNESLPSELFPFIKVYLYDGKRGKRYETSYQTFRTALVGHSNTLIQDNISEPYGNKNGLRLEITPFVINVGSVNQQGNSDVIHEFTGSSSSSLEVVSHIPTLPYNFKIRMPDDSSVTHDLSDNIFKLMGYDYPYDGDLADIEIIIGFNKTIDGDPTLIVNAEEKNEIIFRGLISSIILDENTLNISLVDGMLEATKQEALIGEKVTNELVRFQDRFFSEFDNENRHYNSLPMSEIYGGWDLSQVKKTIEFNLNRLPIIPPARDSKLSTVDIKLQRYDPESQLNKLTWDTRSLQQYQESVEYTDTDGNTQNWKTHLNDHLSPQNHPILNREDDFYFLEQCKYVDKINQSDVRSYKNFSVDYNKGIVKFESPPIRDPEGFLVADYISAYRYKHPAFLAEKLFNQLGYDKKNDGSDLIFEKEELDPNYPAGSPDTTSIKKKVISYLGQITPLEDFSKEGIKAIHHCEIDGMFYYYANKSIWRTDLELLNEKLFSTTYEILQIDSIYLNDYKQTNTTGDPNYVISGSDYEKRLEKKLRLVMSYKRSYRYLFTIPPVKGSLSNMPSSDLTDSNIYPMRDFVSNMDERNFWKEDFTISIGYRDLDGENVNGVKDNIYFQADGFLYLKKWDSSNDKFLTDKKICKIPNYIQYDGNVQPQGTYKVENIRKVLKKTNPKLETDWGLTAYDDGYLIPFVEGNDQENTLHNKKYLMMWSTGFLSTDIELPVIRTETLWFAQVNWDVSSKEITGFVEEKLVDDILIVDHYESKDSLSETIIDEVGEINQEPDPNKLFGTKNTINQDITWGNLLNGINELRYYFNNPNGNAMHKGLEMKEPKFSRRKFGASGNTSVEEFHIDQHESTLYRSSTQYYYPYFLGNELTTNFVIDKSKESTNNSKYDDAYVVAIGCTTHHQYRKSFDNYSVYPEDYIYHPDHPSTFNSTNYPLVDFNDHDITLNSDIQYLFLSYFRLNFISSSTNDKIPDIRLVVNNAHWQPENVGDSFTTGGEGESYPNTIHSSYEYLRKWDIADIDEDDASQGVGYQTKAGAFLLGWNFTTDLMSGLKTSWNDENIDPKNYHSTLERFSTVGFRSSSDCFTGIDMCYENGSVYVLAGSNITKFKRDSEIMRLNTGKSNNIFTLDRTWGEHKNLSMQEFPTLGIQVIEQPGGRLRITLLESDTDANPGWETNLKYGDEVILSGIESGNNNISQDAINKLLHQTFIIHKVEGANRDITLTKTIDELEQVVNYSFDGDDLDDLTLTNAKVSSAKSGQSGRLYAVRWRDDSDVSELFKSVAQNLLPSEFDFESDDHESSSGTDHNNIHGTNANFDPNWGNLKQEKGNYINSFYWETIRGAYTINGEYLGGTYGDNPPAKVILKDEQSPLGDWLHNRVTPTGRDPSWRYWWQSDQMPTGSHLFNDGFSSYSEFSYRFPSVKGFNSSQRLHQQYGLTKMKGKEVFSLVAVNRDYNTYIPNTKSEKERISNRSIGGDKMYSNIRGEVQTDNDKGHLFGPHKFSSDKLKSVQQFEEGLNSVILMLDLREIDYYDDFDTSNNEDGKKLSRLRPISSIMPTCMHDAFFKTLDEVTNHYEQFRWVKDSSGRYEKLSKTLQENIGKGYSEYVPQQYSLTSSTSGRGDGTWWGDIQMSMTMSGGGHDALNHFKFTSPSFQFTPMKSMWVYASRDDTELQTALDDVKSVVFSLGATHGQFSKIYSQASAYGDGAIPNFTADWSTKKYKFGQFNVSWRHFSGESTRVGAGVGVFTTALERWRRIHANLNVMNTLLPKTSQTIGNDLSYVVGNYGEYLTNTDWLMIPEQFKDFTELTSERGGNKQDNHGSLVFVPNNFNLEDDEVNYFPSQNKGYMHMPDNERVYKDFLTKPLNLIIKDENEEFNREETHFICGVSVGNRILEKEQTFKRNKTNTIEKFTQPLMFYRKLEPENYIWTCLSDYLKPRVPIANFKGRSIKDSLQDLAMIMDYDFGIKNGEPFFEPSFKNYITPYTYYDKTGSPGVIEYYTPRVVEGVPDTNGASNPSTDRKDAMIVPDDITFINGKYFFMSGEIIFIHEKINNPSPLNAPTDSMIDSLPDTATMTADVNLISKRWRYVARNIHNSSIDKNLLLALPQYDYIIETNGVRRLSLLKDILLFEIKMIADDKNIIDISDYGRTYEVQDYTDIHLHYGEDKVYKKVINTSSNLKDGKFKRIFRKDLPFVENKDWIKFLSKKIQRLIKQEKYKIEFSTKLIPSLKYGDYIAIYNKRFNIGKDFQQTNNSQPNNKETFLNYELFRISNANHNLTNFTTEITAYTVDINTIGVNVATINGSSSGIRQIDEGTVT